LTNHNREKQREANKAQKEQEKLVLSRIQDYTKTFCTEHGKRVLKDMRKSAGRYVFDPNPFVMARNEGKREMILEIEDMILMGKKPELLESLFTNPEDDGFES